jgi:hypothetical protein
MLKIIGSILGKVSGVIGWHSDPQIFFIFRKWTCSTEMAAGVMPEILDA